MMFYLTEEEILLILDSLNIFQKMYDSNAITFFKKGDTKNYLAARVKRREASNLEEKLKDRISGGFHA